jgi:hypothetical protein
MNFSKKLIVLTVCAVTLVAIALGTFMLLRNEMDLFVTEFYMDTGLAAIDQSSETWSYADKPGHVTLVLFRGRPHSSFTTAHGWSERLSLELSESPSTGQVTKGIFGFSSERWIMCEGVKGKVTIHSVSESEIVATYDLAVHADDGWGHVHYTARFQGTSTFFRQMPNRNSLAAKGTLASYSFEGRGR